MVTQNFGEVTNRAFPNVAHGDKWIFTFSNIPTLADMSEMRYFDSYIKSFSLPNYDVGTINVEGPFGFVVRHPLGGVKANTDLAPISMEFKASEDLYNYITMMKWIHNLRYGSTDQKPEDLFRLYACMVGTLTMMDNQKRPVAEIRFTKLLPTSLGSLSLTNGTTDELLFSVTFSYEEVDYYFHDPLVGGINPTAPELISPCSAIAQPLAPTGKWL